MHRVLGPFRSGAAEVCGMPYLAQDQQLGAKHLKGPSALVFATSPELGSLGMEAHPN